MAHKVYRPGYEGKGNMSSLLLNISSDLKRNLNISIKKIYHITPLVQFHFYFEVISIMEIPHNVCKKINVPTTLATHTQRGHIKWTEAPFVVLFLIPWIWI